MLDVERTWLQHIASGVMAGMSIAMFVSGEYQPSAGFAIAWATIRCWR